MVNVWVGNQYNCLLLDDIMLRLKWYEKKKRNLKTLANPTDLRGKQIKK